MKFTVMVVRMMRRTVMRLRNQIQYFLIGFGEIEKWVLHVIVYDMRKTVLMQQTVCLVKNVCVDLMLALLNVRLDFFQCIRRCQAYANLFLFWTRKYSGRETI